MKISVIIPLFNKEACIVRAIDSVLQQTEQDFEIIVVDDGSTDGSALRMETRLGSGKIRLLQQKNAGVSAARNAGAFAARADLLAFLDADDEWDPRFLFTVLRLRAAFPEADVVGTLYSVREGDGTISVPRVEDHLGPHYTGLIRDYLDLIRSVLPFNASSFAVTKRAFESVGGFADRVPFGEDVDLWIRLCLRYAIAYSGEPLATYHRDASGRACDLYYPSMNEYYPVRNLAQLLRRGDVSNRQRQSAIEYIAKHQLGLARAFLHRGDKSRARQLVLSCQGTRAYAPTWVVLYFCTFVPSPALRSLVAVRGLLRERPC